MPDRSIKTRKTPGIVAASLVLVAISLSIAALLDAPLTWDGGYYLFRMLDSGEPLVVHNRHTDYVLHLPVVWAMNLTDTQWLVRLVFNLVHVTTPLIALVLSWWLVKRDAPALFVWPALGIGLTLLPGQINFISEGIKSEQLMWPLVMAIVIGLPRRSWVPILILVPAITWFHPVAVPIFIASALAALVHAWLQPSFRKRLVWLAIVLIAIAAWRFFGISSSYESQEMTWETQQRQWSNSATGAPTLALTIAALLAISLLVWPRLPEHWRPRVHHLQTAAVTVATLALLFWASEPSNWWEGLEYRGPAFALTMLGTGALFLASVVRLRHGEEPEAPFDPRLSSTLLIGFSLVIMVQSIAWFGVVRDMRAQLESSPQACIAREDLRGYPFTPLNLWSTNAFSLLYQGTSPAKISMRATDCHTANTTGKVAIGDSGSPYNGNNFSLEILQSRLPEASVCTWQETMGWYQQEALIPDSWRWSEGTGSIDINLEKPGSVLIRGEFRTLEAPNTIRVLVSNTDVESFEVTGLGSEPFALLPLELPAGTTTITFVSDNPSATVPNDDRMLAISLWNLEIHPSDGSSPCLKIDEPVG